MQSVMTHDFSKAPQITAPRSKFDRSHGHKFTCDIDWLIPYYWDSILPGDTFSLQSTIFARLATPLFPIMDNMHVSTHFFFVPNRIIWDNWRKFCGEQEDPGDSIDYTIPILSGTRNSDADGNLATDTGRTGHLLNLIGVPDGIDATDVDISALPFRSYQRIYNEWFRDQNLIDSVYTLTTDGPDSDSTTGMRLLRRGKRHDYFTSCLPWPQKPDSTYGSGGVTLPLGTSAPVYSDAADNTSIAVYSTTQSAYKTMDTDGTVGGHLTMDSGPLAEAQSLYADLTTATAATINDLREAFQIQKLLERDAMSGTRYHELIQNHFGVTIPYPAYRPEYLGGGRTPVNVNPVSNTSGSSGDLGDQGAYGTFLAQGHGFTKSFHEHGIVMGILSVTADLTYQQGLDRHFSHSTRYDIYWPSLAHLGNQSVLNKEIYCDGSANDDLVFGYQERYAEYRYKKSQISGLFQSAATATLEAWHLSQDFASLPTLGQTFIESTTDLDRCIAVASEPHFIVDTYQKLICARPMPVYGTPGMIDHF